MIVKSPDVQHQALLETGLKRPLILKVKYVTVRTYPSL